MTGKRNSKKRNFAFFRSLRPERKILLTIEGERIVSNPDSLEKAYRQIRGKDKTKTDHKETEGAVQR